MFCNKCGTENSSNARFCSNCGNKLIIESSQSMRSKTPQLWNPNATANWSLLFTPIFGSYLQMKNWQALGNLNEAKNSRIWLIFTIFFIFVLNIGAVCVWDDPVKLDTYPRSLGLFYIIVWYFLHARKQQKYVQEKLNDEYEKKSWWMPIITSTVILLISSALLITLKSVMLDQLNQAKHPIQEQSQYINSSSNSIEQKPWEINWEKSGNAELNNQK